MFKSSQIHHLSRLLPLLSDRQFHNLDIACRGGDVIVLVMSTTVMVVPHGHEHDNVEADGGHGYDRIAEAET